MSMDDIRRAMQDGELVPSIAENPYFRVLGYANVDAKPVFFFYNRRSRGVCAFQATQLRKENVSSICTSSYLETLFPEAESAGQRVDAFREAAISLAYQRGVFTVNRVRGIGAWLDADRVVLNLGDKLIVDGEDIELDGMSDSKYSYEARAAQRVAMDRPLTAEEGQEFVTFLERFSWERDANGPLLAGWLFTAQICGALSWRPHAWIYGPAGSGKSWIVENVASPCIGDFGVFTQFSTTEAGLRQKLQRDALPVLFDEAEGEDIAAQRRIQSIMGLMRQASSASGGMVLKGSTDGVAQAYDVKTQFLFASISSGVVQSSDETRITLLGLRPGGGDFEIIQAERARLITPDYSERLLARAVQRLPQFMESKPAFVAALEKRTGSRRLGDQVGTLMTGAWCLMADQVATMHDAEHLCAQYDWENEDIVQEDPDCQKCFRFLIEWILDIQGEHARHRMSVGQIALIAAGRKPNQDVTAKAANELLKNHGLAVRRTGGDEVMSISARHSELKARLAGTPWAVGWHHVLKNHPAATAFNQHARFGPGQPHRSVSVAISELTGDEPQVLDSS